MKEFFRLFFLRSRVRKILAVFLIIVGTVALVTPLSPGAWLIPIGLGFLGVRLAFWEKIKVWWSKDKSKYKDVE